MPNSPGPVQVPSASHHPIAVVAERTGLSRDVLRVWERRYKAVEPPRTAGGQRFYSDEHINRFRLLAEATRHGRSIRHVAPLSTDELASLVATDAAERSVTGSYAGVPELDVAVAESLRHIRSFDGAGLDRVLRRSLANHGLPAFLEQMVPHLMHSIGEEWVAGEITIAHEHLASAAVMAILFEAMRSLPATPSSKRLLVVTPAGERHAIGAALAATAAALEGWTIIYLGSDVPSADIVSAASSTGAHAILLSVVHTADREMLVQNLRAVRNGVPAGIPLLVGGAAANDAAALLAGEGVVICHNFADMRNALVHYNVAA